MARRRQEALMEEEEMERELEERMMKSARRPSRDYPETSKRGRKKNKTPLLLRVLAWCGVILFCFVVGYVGTEYIVKNVLHLDDPWSNLGGESGNSRDLSVTAPLLNAADSGVIKLDMQKATFSIFYPRDNALKTEKVDVIARTMEDNIHEVVLKVLKLSGMFGETVGILHVFRDVDMVYLDFSAPFLAALNAAGESFSSLFITGITRTMNDNFSLTKVRFLVDSKIVSSGSPVDLTAVWQLQR